MVWNCHFPTSFSCSKPFSEFLSFPPFLPPSTRNFTNLNTFCACEQEPTCGTIFTKSYTLSTAKITGEVFHVYVISVFCSTWKLLPFCFNSNSTNHFLGRECLGLLHRLCRDPWTCRASYRELFWRPREEKKKQLLSSPHFLELNSAFVFPQVCNQLSILAACIFLICQFLLFSLTTDH